MAIARITTDPRKTVPSREPELPVKMPWLADARLFAVVPFVIDMKAPGDKLLQKSLVIGVSSDEGKTWVFVNGDVDIKQLKQILPNLPDELKRPAKQKPVFEKE